MKFINITFLTFAKGMRELGIPQVTLCMNVNISCQLMVNKQQGNNTFGPNCNVQ